MRQGERISQAPTGRLFSDFDDENITDEAEDDGVDALKIGIHFNVATLPAVICGIVSEALWASIKPRCITRPLAAGEGWYPCGWTPHT